MKSLKIGLLLMLATISNSIVAQHEIRLKVTGVTSDAGDILYAIYTDESSFLKFDKVFKAGSQKAVEGETNLHITDIPDGYYAIAIFHDENGNTKLDTNMLGIPKEEVAFSKGEMKMFGPPKFDECAFTLNSDMEMTISFE